MSITFEDISVIRTNARRTTSLKVVDGKPILRAPKHVPEIKLRHFVHKNQDWIEQQLAAQHQQERTYNQGEHFLFLGKAYFLHLSFDNKSKRTTSVQLNDTQLHISLPEQYHAESNRQVVSRIVQQTLQQWYQNQAQQWLLDRTAHYADIIGVSPSSVHVRRYKSRWGCCNQSGKIIYNWIIIMAPVEMIDYIIVHELCHLIELNHSPRFWAHVERHYPDRRIAEKWFKTQGLTLQI